MWFPTINNLVVIDPAEVRPNLVAPLVVIERVIADGVTMDTRMSANVPPGRVDLEFEFTGLGFIEPEKSSLRRPEAL